MSEEEIIDAIVDKIVKILLMKYPSDATEESGQWAIDFNDNHLTIFTFASVICAHLKVCIIC